ncbi:MAG: hypothetical protein U1D67_05320, partial [Dehalococcoidia bacterium]|nr:hypothetical protein [Dehalococcoidia bacterium]
ILEKQTASKIAGKAPPIEGAVSTATSAPNEATIKNVGELLTACSKKHRFDRAAVLQILGLKDVKDIKDPGKAWAYIQKYAQTGSDEAFNAI